VLFLDLDNFKVVNDSLGHHAGDQLLIIAAERLRDCLRPRDTAARLGGDEFTVLLENVTDVADAVRVAERIGQALQAPILLGSRELFASASIGIALSGSGRDEPETLLRNADLAMYQAKTNGKARFELFDDSMNVRAVERLALESDLRRALERDEFCIYYQPIILLETGELVGFEALVRWRHPERGIVSPADFIPIAEETGLILPLGYSVLEQSCRQVRDWQIRYPEYQALTISVNVSAKQLQHPGLVGEVSEALRISQLEPSQLKLEITESVMMQDAESTIEKLRQLRSLWIQLAVDDFGTGYSSLAYLKRFPISILKIDRSFVNGLGEDPEDTAIVHSIVSLARALRLTVTAEGIETAHQLAQLRSLGCELGQGYYFGRPLPSHGAEALLAVSADESELVGAGASRLIKLNGQRT
jgi:diguanylate cyclase (GGDEF)-like protein